MDNNMNAMHNIYACLNPNFNNMMYQNLQVPNQTWSQAACQGNEQVPQIYTNEIVTNNSSNKDIGLKKSPWTLDEEQIF